MLVENFLRYDGKGDVPSQIHSYLSSNFKDLRNLAKGNPTLRAKAKDRWYVPDPNKATDLEKLRERALLREFKEYRESRQRRLKVFPPGSRPGRVQESLAGTRLRYRHRRRPQDCRSHPPRGPQAPHVVRPGPHPNGCGRKCLKVRKS